jgi:hypothetical protein
MRILADGSVQVRIEEMCKVLCCSIVSDGSSSNIATQRGCCHVHSNVDLICSFIENLTSRPHGPCRRRRKRKQTGAPNCFSTGTNTTCMLCNEKLHAPCTSNACRLCFL